VYGQHEHWQQRGAEFWVDLDRWSPGRWSVRRGAAVDGSLRASDAERSHVADLLSQHFGQGRLDTTEFDDRLGRAMKAKVRSELTELLADLPPVNPEASVPARPHRHSLLLTIALCALVLALATSVAASAHIPFLLFCVGLVLLWQRSRSHGRRRDRADSARARS